MAVVLYGTSITGRITTRLLAMRQTTWIAPGVGALVEAAAANGITLNLVNLDLDAAKNVIVS